MMLDADVVAVSPSSVYRVLRNAGLMERHNTKVSLKGTGFHQPLGPHEHWHVDIAYINIRGTFFFLCSLLDGFSRSIVHWEIRPKMEEGDIETIIQRTRERHPDTHPRNISDNGPQFIARDFKEFIRICGMTYVEDAVRLIEGYVRQYNEVRLYSAIGYVTPADKLLGRDKEIFAERDRKLDEARTRRKSIRAEQRHAS
jgi:putative transposase